MALDAYKCPRCDRSFRQAAGLAVHLKCCNAGTQPSDPSTACSPTNPDFASVAPVCPRCFKSFKSRGGLGKHLLTCSVTTNEHVCPVCPRSFRSKSGLSSHLRAKHKEYKSADRLPTTSFRQEEQSLQDRSESEVCKTTELASTDAATDQQPQHSVGSPPDCSSPPSFSTSQQNIHRPTTQPKTSAHSDFSRSARLSVPRANANKEWTVADTTIELSLTQACPSFNRLPPEKMLSALVNAIRFYFPSSTERTVAKNKNKENRLKHLRNRKRELRKEWRSRRHEPPSQTAALRREFHAVHRRIKRLSAHFRNEHLETSKRNNMRSFRADPFAFGKKLLNDKTVVEPDFSVQKAHEHFVRAYSDQDRSAPYDAFPEACEIRPPTSSFPLAIPSRSMFTQCVRKMRNGSAPGPNGIPYLVWKRCPSLEQRLYTICCKVWRSASIPAAWCEAVIILVYKKGDPSDPSNFRPIALSNCDGKIFFSVVSRRTNEFMLNNSYFDGQTQKGFLPGIAGCVEHACLTGETLRDARTYHRSVCFAWIDLRNAFGSIRHMLIQHSLRHYHFPPHLCQLVFSYYEQLVAKISLGQGTESLTPAFHYAIGVFQGCVLSPVLFNICFQPLLDVVHTKSLTNGWSYTFSSNPSISRDASAYADDLELCSWSSPCCQAQLDLTDRYLRWSRSLVARPDKCVATAMHLVKTSSAETHYTRFDPKLAISGDPLRFLQEEDFRYLGKPINTQLSEAQCRQSTRDLLSSLLTAVDKTALATSAKVWLYHHFVTSKLSWPLLINDLTLSFARELQSSATKMLKRWIGLPRCANPSILFVGSRSHNGLRVRNLVTLWKQQQHIKLSLLQTSPDPRCQSLYESIYHRQEKWLRKFAPAVEAECARTVVIASLQAETQNMAPLAAPCQKPQRPFSRSQNRVQDRVVRHGVNSYIREIDVAQQLERLRSLQVQGRWLEWTQHMHQDFSWQCLIHNWSDAELRFALQAVTDTAPSANNLHRWGHQELDPSCSFCGRTGTLRHVLNACSVALHQGRYTWRHNSVLSVVRHRLRAFWTSTSTKEAVKAIMASKTTRFIRFVRAGRPTTNSSCPLRRPLSSQAILLHADDWEFLYDLGPDPFRFPVEIASTSLRPDVVIFSRSNKTVVLLELTVPLEDRSHLAHDRKKSKYSELAATCEQNGFTVHLLPFEVGCLGFCPHTILRTFESLGLPKSAARQIRLECSRVALRCSYLLFLRRHIPQWQEDVLY